MDRERFEKLAPAVRQGQVCTWPLVATLDTFNIAGPDANATYWIMPYILPPGSTLLVRGSYPFARYFSFTTNIGQPGGGGFDVLAGLADRAIAPDPGSSNPFVSGAAPADLARRRYTVRVTPGGGEGGSSSANTLPSQASGKEEQVGLLIYRLYMPDDPADRPGGVPLPDLTLVDAAGGERRLTPGTAAEQATWMPPFEAFVRTVLLGAPPVVLPSGAQAPRFAPVIFPGLAPNPDNRYLGAELVWAPGRVAVLRGRAPTFPNTRTGVSITGPGQLRYWSFGTIEYRQPYPTIGGVADEAIPLNADGNYTVVISTAEDRPANATAANGVAWVPWGDPSVPVMVLLRHMLPAPDFAQASRRVPDGATPEETQAIMGSYYPVAAYCDRARFEAERPARAEALLASSPTCG
jgi:hypothetical protein